MNFIKLLKLNIAEIFFVFIAFGILVTIGSFSIGSIIRKASLSTVTIALKETDKTIQAYLREPKIAFFNIYTAIQDLLDRGESQETVSQFLSQTSYMLLNQGEGITGFLSVYGYIRGDYISGVQTIHKANFIPQQEPWYQLAIRTKTADFTAPYVDIETGLTVISLAQEIYGKEGTYYGVLALNIDISWLMAYVESLQFSKGGYGMILNQFLYVLAHPHEEYKYAPLHNLGEDYLKIADLLRNYQNVSSEIINDTDNSKVIVFFQQTHIGWFVGVVMPVKSYYADLRTAVSLLISLGTILACFLSYILLRLSKARMEADEESRHKSTFLAWISHEMRTPLNSIMGIVQIQMQKGNLLAEYADALKRIYISSSGLLGIINDVLDLSKIETGKLELHNSIYSVADFINDTVQTNIINIKEKPITFSLEIDENLPAQLYGDELRIKQILNNLLSNAIKYTNKGSVNLSIHHTTLPSPSKNIKLLIKVEDTGQGMKPDDIKKLFSEYLRFNEEANKNIEGTGIGLRITKNIVELMNGNIKVESIYGEGTTFLVDVIQETIDTNTLGKETTKNLLDFSYIGSKLLSQKDIVRHKMPEGKVLVVDDLESNLYVARGLLQIYDLQIETALSGQETLDKISKGKIYDIIFMDHMMPIMDGIETTHKLREMGYTGTIVVLTANAIVGNAAMFKEEGFDDYISKPIDVQKLNDVLGKYIVGSETPPTFMGGTDPKFQEIFYKDLDKCITTLKDIEAEMDIKLFTTNVHALKSALLILGENEASTQAANLEKAGTEGDLTYINLHSQNFIQYLEDLKERLSPNEITASSEEDTIEDLAFLQEQLAIIKSACENYDDKTIYDTLDLLKEKTWKTKTLNTLTLIYDAVFFHSDFELAGELCAELSQVSL